MMKKDDENEDNFNCNRNLIKSKEMIKFLDLYDEEDEEENCLLVKNNVVSSYFDKHKKFYYILKIKY